MAAFRGAGSVRVAIAALLCLSVVVGGQAANWSKPKALSEVFDAWNHNCKFSPDGMGADLVLDKYTVYTGMHSKTQYLFGSFGAWIKLPANNSAGTVTTFYMASAGPNHSEFDFEFLGNKSGDPYLLHTNIFVDGVGGREQQIYLTFDPRDDYHFYHFEWNKDILVFFVDNTPIRMFRNLGGIVRNFKYPNSKAMRIYASIWDGSNWATCGGRVKLDWAAAPFVASYKSIKLSGCPVSEFNHNKDIRGCRKSWFAAPGIKAQKMDGGRVRQMRKVRATQVKYNYCDDRARYPTPPPECAYNYM